MVRLVIGAALAYAAFRIGRELLDVPEIERGPNAADFPAEKPKRKPARPRSRKPSRAETA